MENVTRQEDGRYEVNFPWIPGRKPCSTNEVQSRKRLLNINRKLIQNHELKEEYDNIIKEQLSEGIVEEAPEKPIAWGSRFLHAT